ncbi:proline racemase family protein, partial [Rhodococcus koreensis]
GTLTDITDVGPHRAVLPSVSGRGWITGFNQYVLDADDPFPRGYTLGDLWGPESDTTAPQILEPSNLE